MWAGVGAGAVRFGFEDDVDQAAALDGRFEVSGEFGEGVGREADEQYPRVRARDEVVQDGGGEALLASGSRAGPDRARSLGIRIAACA